MDARDFTDHIFTQFARIGSALGHAKRVEIVDVLLQGERTVESLAQQISASVANTSRHLQILASAGLVSRRIEGTSRVYAVADRAVADAYLTLVNLAETHLSEITALANDFFSEIDGATPISFEEFEQLSDSGQAILVDVRPASEYAAGHVEGAINIPLADLEARISELPVDRNIVAYCRGSYCVMAAHAVARLREGGRNAARLGGGYPEWQLSGRPVAARSGVPSAQFQALEPRRRSFGQPLLPGVPQIGDSALFGIAESDELADWE